LGRIRVDIDATTKDWPSGLHGGFHHMGTTRMHQNPEHGVVDADCKVHGIGNLFIAGSSVFPTCGFSNPTLTIVALGIRLAEHVKRLMHEELA
jgi:choline dehydrogenase-like flavoprotein